MSDTYTETENYGLELYGDKDPADFRNGHNKNMVTLDGILKRHSDGLAANDRKADAASAAASKAQQTADGAVTSIAQLKDKEAQDKADSDRKLDTLSGDVYHKAEADGKFADKVGTARETSRLDSAIASQKADLEGYKKDADLRIWSASNNGVNVVDKIGNQWNNDRLLLVAHRCGTGFPEQSLEGAEWCWEHGFAPECDVRLLADGVPVLCHDDTIGRTMTRTTAISANERVSNILTWQWAASYIKPRVEGGRFESAPTLQRYLEASAGRPSVIECKQLDTQTMDRICELVDIFGLKNSVWIICFDPGLCRRAAKQGFHVQALYGSVPTESDLAALKGDGVEWVSLEQGNITAGNVNYLHDRGFKVMAWTVDSKAGYWSASGSGVDGVTSNRIDYVSNRTSFTGEFHRPGCRDFRTNWSDERKEHVGGDGLRTAGSTFYHHGGRNTRYLVVEPYGCSNLWIHEDAGFYPQMHVWGNSGDQGDHVNAERSFIRFGLYSKPDQDDVWVDPAGNPGIPANTGQEFAEVVCRHNGQVDAFCYNRGNNKGTQGTKLPAFGPAERIAYDLYVTFGNHSLTVRGMIQGHSYTELIKYDPVSLDYEDTAKFTPFICFDDDSVGDVCGCEISYVQGSAN